MFEDDSLRDVFTLHEDVKMSVPIAFNASDLDQETSSRERFFPELPMPKIAERFEHSFAHSRQVGLVLHRQSEMPEALIITELSFGQHLCHAGADFPSSGSGTHGAKSVLTVHRDADGVITVLAEDGFIDVFVWRIHSKPALEGEMRLKSTDV